MTARPQDWPTTWVVKVGTNVLARPDDSLDVARIEGLADQVAELIGRGHEVVLVSSGAVGAGMGRMGLAERPRDLPHLQAAAAVGQAQLIRHYDRAFRRHGRHAAQLLLTGNDFRHRQRYLNIRNTLATLFEYRAIPVVNENDTTSVREIAFGDNDRLAAMVASLFPSPLLVIATSVAGLLDGPPGDPASRRIAEVPRWTDSLADLAAAETSSRGRGGMASKLEAIRQATEAGCPVLLADGREPDFLVRLHDGEDLGTRFAAGEHAVPAFKRWIGFTITPHGRLHLDAGAVAALAQNGRSLLPIGVRSVEGDFEKGELVSLVDPDGQEFARGLTNHSAAEVAELIAGRRSADADGQARPPGYREVVHRDNLALTRRQGRSAGPQAAGQNLNNPPSRVET